MSAELIYGLPVGDEGEIEIPGELGDLVPEGTMIAMDEIPVAVAYKLRDEPDGDVWEHPFTCPDVRMFAADGCVVILGSFKASNWVGFSDDCDPTEEDS